MHARAHVFTYISLPVAYVVTVVCKLNGPSDCGGGVKMVLAFDRCASLTSLLLVLLASTLVHSQAPGDAESQSCTKKAVPDGVVRLLDSGWYRTLLSGGTDAAEWTQTSGSSVSEWITCRHAFNCGVIYIRLYILHALDR